MSNGVLKYEHYYAVLQTSFPEGKARCSFCTFYNKSNNRCNLNQSLCFFPHERMNDDCPLVPVESEVNE